MIIKVCGMRDPENIHAVEQAGADWMGFIFHPRSPRFVFECPTYMPHRCRRVGVFVDANLSTILQKTKEFQLQYVQLHGQESSDFCEQLLSLLPSQTKLIKMIPVLSAEDLAGVEPYVPFVHYFLFETKLLQQGNYYGGSGHQFDWSILSRYPFDIPFMLTGGIGPEDAPRLRQIRHPRFAGIDLNSRFETAPGIKDAAAIKTFIEQIRTHQAI